jgi:3-phosphoshikimate 1-carboxyvinyltransferase
MAMSFAILGLRADGVRILDPSCVAKTFPDFFERLAALTGAPLDHSPGLLDG